MVDMKMETLVQKGVVSDTMAGILRGSLEQRHQDVMDVADQRLTARREPALSGEGSIPNLNRNLFQPIYDTVQGRYLNASDEDALSYAQHTILNSQA